MTMWLDEPDTKMAVLPPKAPACEKCRFYYDGYYCRRLELNTGKMEFRRGEDYVSASNARVHCRDSVEDNKLTYFEPKSPSPKIPWYLRLAYRIAKG